MKHLASTLLLSLLCGVAAAQAPTAHANLFGMGRVRQLDTYLSPFEYRGPQLFYVNESERPTALMHQRVQFQSTLQLDFSSAKPASEKATYLGGNITYSAAWHYRFLGLPMDSLPSDCHSRFSLLAGPQLEAATGGLYNTRNGNNPAQAYLAAHLAASVQAGYTFRLRRTAVRLRDQLDVPLIGAMFSPAYGQSYYEIFSLEQSDHNVCATHPFNAPSLRNQLSVDIALRYATMRLSYLTDIRQSHVNSLRRHAYSQAFMIGWVRNVRILPPLRYENNR
ncbi:MAG: DUF3316 domain-containing protein [Bacteroidaceae bacterium]|nr:DUF3316 domain-containing protein [Bacteroidaceae bacterium]